MYSRRQFGQTLLAASAARGNRWSARGMKLGVSHQRPEMLTADHLQYLKNMGVEYLEVRIPSAQRAYDNLVAIKRKVEGAGLKLFEIMLDDGYNPPEIQSFQVFLRDLGKAGIDATTYAWNTYGPGGATGTEMTRDCRSRAFDLSKVPPPAAGPRRYSEQEEWERYADFIRRVLPVAEEAGVRLQLHPNDPPIDYGGSARLFKSRKAYRRALEIANYSPYSGFLFCVGTWGEMAGEDGKGEDIVGAIHEFGSRGHIFQVHYRNVSSPVPAFHETFPDNGYVNLYRIMRALGEVEFNGMVVPDHVPQCGNTPGVDRVSEAYIFGYIRAMIQAVETELGRRA